MVPLYLCLLSSTVAPTFYVVIANGLAFSYRLPSRAPWFKILKPKQNFPQPELSVASVTWSKVEPVTGIEREVWKFREGAVPLSW